MPKTVAPTLAQINMRKFRKSAITPALVYLPKVYNALITLIQMH
jgi:hypothetical protein